MHYLRLFRTITSPSSIAKRDHVGGSSVGHLQTGKSAVTRGSEERSKLVSTYTVYTLKSRGGSRWKPLNSNRSLVGRLPDALRCVTHNIHGAWLGLLDIKHLLKQD